MIIEYSTIKTKIAKNGFPAGTKGVVVSIYGKGSGCEVELWDENGNPVDVVTYTFDELDPIVGNSQKTINDFSWGDWVRCHGQIMFVQDSSDDDLNGKLGLLSENAPRVFDEENQCLFSKADYYPIDEVESLPRAIVDESVLRQFFRLETSPWKLAAECKYPFADESGTFNLTEEDLTAFSANLKNVDSIVLDAWEEQFIAKHNVTHVYCEETDMCGFSLAFTWDVIKDRFGWFEIEEDDPQDITAIVNTYFNSKGKALDELDVSDGLKCDIITRIQDYAKKFEVNDTQRNAYYRYLKELCAKNDAWAIETLAYAYYGGNKLLPCDWYQAEYWLLRLYELGDSFAANSLGYIYYSDRLGKPDYQRAFFYFSKAAEHNIIEAKYKLSDMYRKGHGTEENHHKAFTILDSLYDDQLQAFQEENYGCHYADIALRIGYCYEDGIGTAINIHKAHEYFERACYAIEMRILHAKHFGDDIVKLNVQRALQRIEGKDCIVPVEIYDLPGWPRSMKHSINIKEKTALWEDICFLFQSDWNSEDFDPEGKEEHLEKAEEMRTQYDDTDIFTASVTWMDEHCIELNQYINFANLFVYYGFNDCKVVNPYPFLAVLYNSVDWNNVSEYSAANDIFWSISTGLLKSSGILKEYYYDEYEPLQDARLLDEMKRQRNV